MSEQKPPEDQTPAETPPEEKTFTQADLDRVVSERLKREREKFGDVDELRQKAKDYDALQEAQKTELQKAADRAEAAETRARVLEEGLKQERTRNAITAAASKANFHDPEDAFRLLDDVELDEDGTPKNIDKLLKNLATAKPHLVKDGETVTNGSGDGGPRGKSTSAKTPGEEFGDLVAERLGR